MNQKQTIAVTIAALALLIIIFIWVEGARISDRVSPGLGRVSSGRLGVSEAAAHANAGSQRPTLCYVCHGDMKTEITPWHQMHLLMTFVNFQCSTCHKKVTTGPRTVKGKVLIDRSVCPRCHGQKFPAFNEEHQKPTWQQQHKLLRGDKTGGAEIYPLSILRTKYPKCFICHRQKELSFCKDCHEYHPHNDKWVNGQHGKTAVATDFSCLRCHEKTTWCTTQCHKGITLPHNIPRWSKHYAKDSVSPLWMRAHPYIADSVRVVQTSDFTASDPGYVCSMCHDRERKAANFCQRCHHQGFNGYINPNAPWKPQHPSVVKRIGSSECQRCHLLEFCAYCHTNGEKPARGMFLNRDQEPVPPRRK